MSAVKTPMPEAGSLTWPSAERRRQAAAMGARERMVRAEVREDRHHHPAQEVAALRVRLGGDLHLQRFEAVLVVAAVPALERVEELRSRAVRREPDTRGEPLGDEVARQRLEDHEGLLVVATFDQQPAQ